GSIDEQTSRGSSHVDGVAVAGVQSRVGVPHRVQDIERVEAAAAPDNHGVSIRTQNGSAAVELKDIAVECARGIVLVHPVVDVDDVAAAFGPAFDRALDGGQAVIASHDQVVSTFAEIDVEVGGGGADVDGVRSRPRFNSHRHFGVFDVEVVSTAAGG